MLKTPTNGDDVLTAATITDEQIRELQQDLLDHREYAAHHDAIMANVLPAGAGRHCLRARCAEILNARAKGAK